MPLLFICFVYLLRLRVDVDTSGNFEEEGVHQDQDQYQDLFQGKLYLWSYWTQFSKYFDSNYCIYFKYLFKCFGISYIPFDYTHLAYCIIMIFCHPSLINRCSQTVSKSGRPKSSKSTHVNDPNSNNIQIKLNKNLRKVGLEFIWI